MLADTTLQRRWMTVAVQISDMMGNQRPVMREGIGREWYNFTCVQWERAGRLLEAHAMERFPGLRVQASPQPSEDLLELLELPIQLFTPQINLNLVEGLIAAYAHQNKSILTMTQYVQAESEGQNLSGLVLVPTNDFGLSACWAQP